MVQSIRRSGWTALLALLLLAPSSPAAAQGFGGAVAFAGDQAFIGQVSNTSYAGSVLVVSVGSDGQWQETGRLVPDVSGDPLPDRFGRSLDVDGSILVVGATTTDDELGAAYVFERRGDGTWHQIQMLQPDDLVGGDNFGRAVAVHGDRILVSSAGKNDAAGAVYVFRRGSDGVFSEEAQLSAPDAVPGAYFGLAVALEGSHALVTAIGLSRAWGFRFDASTGRWVSTGALDPDPSVEGASFGASVVLRNGRAFVGAPTVANRGEVYGFSFDAALEAWVPTGSLLPYDGAMAYFGAGLAFVGDELWVSAPLADRSAGGVYRFAPDSDGGWAGSMLFSGGQAVSARQFGGAVAGNASTVIVGVPGDLSGVGTAFVYQGSGHALEQVARFEGQKPEAAASITGSKVRCEDGDASGYACKGYDMLSFLSVDDLGGAFGVQMNDVWGWTDPATGHEWVLAGRTNGLSFVDVTDPYNPRFVGDLPMTEGANAAAWRDVKVYKDHAFIVADGSGPHGMQVFDLTRLRNVADAPTTFTPDALYTGIKSAHNIVINEESGFAYSVGSSMGGETCGGGYHIIDVRDPLNPTMAGCWGHAGTGGSGTGYSHDAQCVIYHGPDAAYRGREICLGSNETAVSIADLTDKANPKPIAVAEYPNVAYTHQGWLTEDHRFFYVNDELDEAGGKVETTRTLIWDLTDLDEPELVKEFFGSTPAIDHNLYVKGSLMYQSNYSSGLRVIDITDPANPVEVGYFDVNPLSNAAEFTGTWSNYPYFQSGTIAVTSIERGLFLVKKQDVDI